MPRNPTMLPRCYCHTLRQPLLHAPLILLGPVEGSCQALAAWPSHETAAGVGLARLLVEHLAGQTEVIALVHQGVQLLTSPQHAVNGLVQHNLGLVCGGPGMHRS